MRIRCSSSRPTVLAIVWFSITARTSSADDSTDGAKPEDKPEVSINGYVEAFYQVHLQNAENRITNLRGFDNRSRTFTLSNVALDVQGDRGPITARVALQIGHTPSTYYLAEPSLPGTAGANASGSELWKYVQTATARIEAPRAVVVEAGLFLSPIGPEVIPVKDNWSWSRSNLFFGLPFYHTGITVSRPLGCGWTGKLHAYNGWNSVTDNNGTPSLAVSAAYANGDTIGQVLYFGGIERSPGAPEGDPWRHLFDAYLQRPLSKTFSVLAHGNAGFERGELGTSWWAAGALYGKLALSSKLYGALRIDAFYERVPAMASAIFWPTKWIGSGTATLAYQPFPNVSARLEYRHDQADSDVFFGGRVTGDGGAVPFAFDRDAQDTITLGATAWF
jgi:hypothetical protein